MDDCISKSGAILLTEYGTCTTQALNSTQRNVLAQHFGNFLRVDPTWVPGECKLTASHFVGTIVLDGISILIRPKVPLENLFYMLTYAYDLPEFRKEETQLSESEDLFEFVVDIFLKQVGRLVRAGLYKSYIDRSENQNYLRGRLQMSQHLHQNSIHKARFFQGINEYTADVLENQILLYTLHQLSFLDFREQLLTNRTRRAAAAFHDVSLTPITPKQCDQIVYTRLNGRYRSAIHLAKLLLQHLSVEEHNGQTPFAAYMFNMNQVFELFVARYLEDFFANHPNLSVEIQDDIWLDIEQNEKGFPDIVLYRDHRPALVLDTKYKQFKKQPSPADRNQMLVYCHALDLNRGLLIFADENKVDFLRTFHPQTILQASNLPLHGSLNEFRARCMDFANALTGATSLAGA